MAKSRSSVSSTRVTARRGEVVPPAEISFKILEFIAVLGKGCASKARMTLTKRNPNVRIDPKQPDVLKVRAPGATIRFTVEPKAYIPIGISFWMLPTNGRAGAEAKLGLVDFDEPQIHRRDHVISINDHFQPGVPYYAYKFSMVIQRVSDGRLGVVDPGIDNES